MIGITGCIRSKKRKHHITSPGILEPHASYRRGESIDNWADDYIEISRVHHGLINPEPQPLFNEDNTLLIMMDGEVFDYKREKSRLLRRGHEFQYEDNDAEYCLHLYEERGKKAFKELNGSYSIGIYNLDAHEFLLASDRFSSRPLYYHLTDDGILTFSPHTSSFLKSPYIPRELDMTAICEFFTFRRVLGARTFIRDVNMLLPATILYFIDGNISFDCYWTPNFKEVKRSEEYYVNMLARTLKKSVVRRTQGASRLGILLSGGLDSRTVLAASDKKMIAFTTGDYENREVKIAKKVAEAKGCRHIFLQRDLDHYPDLLDEAVDIGSGMYSFDHAHFIGFSNKIKKECDILLHGYGLGAIFQGNHIPREEFFIVGKKVSGFSSQKISQREWAHLILKNSRYSLYRFNPRQLFTPRHFHVFRRFMNLFLRQTEKIEKEIVNPYNRYDYFVFSIFPKHYTYLNVTSLRDFMDERTLAFDNDLYTAYLELPPDMRFDGKIYKKALEKLNPIIARMPSANTGFPPLTHLPKLTEWGVANILLLLGNFISRRRHPTFTQSSWPQFDELIRDNRKMKRLLSDVINDPTCLDPHIFNIRRIQDMFKEHLSGQANHTEFLFLLLTFGKWHKNRFLESRSNNN